MVRTRIPIWRVRVKQAIETWIDVESATPELAELEATKVPFVISVFHKSAMPGERKLFRENPRAIEDDEDDR
jgi:hypothetical protein